MLLRFSACPQTQDVSMFKSPCLWHYQHLLGHRQQVDCLCRIIINAISGNLESSASSVATPAIKCVPGAVPTNVLTGQPFLSGACSTHWLEVSAEAVPPADTDTFCATTNSNPTSILPAGIVRYTYGRACLLILLGQSFCSAYMIVEFTLRSSKAVRCHPTDHSARQRNDDRTFLISPIV